jgi:hypothetical protein
MTTLAILIDERRALAAKVAGKDVEIAMALGERDKAYQAMREMRAQIEARKAARAAGCFFDMQGEADRVVLQEAGNGTR